MPSPQNNAVEKKEYESELLKFAVISRYENPEFPGASAVTREAVNGRAQLSVGDRISKSNVGYVFLDSLSSFSPDLTEDNVRQEFLEMTLPDYVVNRAIQKENDVTPPTLAYAFRNVISPSYPGSDRLVDARQVLTNSINNSIAWVNISEHDKIEPREHSEMEKLIVAITQSYISHVRNDGMDPAICREALAEMLPPNLGSIEDRTRILSDVLTDSSHVDPNRSPSMLSIVRKIDSKIKSIEFRSPKVDEPGSVQSSESPTVVAARNRPGR